jgi:hypothetical protein
MVAQFLSRKRDADLHCHLTIAFLLFQIIGYPPHNVLQATLSRTVRFDDTAAQVASLLRRQGRSESCRGKVRPLRRGFLAAAV